MIYKNSLTHIFILILFISVQNFAQVYSQEDEKVCNSKFQFAVNSELSAKPISEVVVEIGKSFMGTNYLAYGLERDGDEQLVINLTGFDCTTFLENVLVFARCIKQNKTSFEDFKAELTLIRYREGKINKYPSRLHYFTDWIYDNEKKKIITDVTEELGGEELLLKLSFMSDNPQYYKQLEQNPDFISVIRKQESEINFCREYFFIPKLKVADVESEFQNGDIVAFTSNIRGLDVNHVGIAVKMENGRTHILHAPEAGTQVQITEQPLSEYVMNVKKHTGVIVLRVNDPQ